MKILEHIEKVRILLWGGDVSYNEFVGWLSGNDQSVLETFLMNNSGLFEDGVPFPDDCKEYKDMLDQNVAGAVLLQDSVMRWE